MKNYKISIIIPVYNVEPYIKKSLDSVINQTYNNLEIILINDGSTDNSGKICDKYAKKDKRIKVIHQTNKRLSKARNNGLDKATGDYIMFVDPDDWLELNACELLINEIISQKKDILIFNIVREYGNESKKNSKFIFNENDKDLKYKTQAKILSSYLKIDNFKIKGIAYTWNKIIKKQLLDNIRFSFEGKKAMYEDVVFCYCLLEKTEKIGFYDKHLYHYRISRKYSYNEDIIKIMDEFYKIIKSYANNHKKDAYYNQSIYSRMLINLHKIINVNIYHKNNNVNVFKKNKMLRNEIKKKQYKEAIKNINYSNLNTYLKIYIVLIKLKLYILVYILNKLELLLREKRIKK